MKAYIIKLSFVVSLIMMLIQCKTKGEEKTNENISVEDNARSKIPDSISIGEMFTIYKLPYAYDHTIIYSSVDKKWHLYGIEAGNKSFIHLTADSLTQEGWEKHKPFTYQDEEIWAPHILEHEGLYYMFYTNIGVPREIRLSISKDLFEWEHFSKEPLFAWSNAANHNLKNKDPMVFRDNVNNQWIMYVTMMKDDKHWAVGYTVSKDLKNWSEYKICFDENTESPGVESPFVVKRGEYYYLTLSARNTWPHGAQEFFKSKSPLKWEVKDLVKSIYPWHAAEIIQDLDGKWYLSRSSGNESDFRLAPFYWNDGIK
ncbi:family 43 glycosylhydrolase [Tamlana sp. 2201CG12-4]|uniref:family 43 glycosylhydrolase n=1 Tax=Tamlana sp. 2201CG12-4 TaxID=3112582 RepID=UPI002DBE9B70|nr:family 43 glycosylhydrolase [Tamlana sp. 2201CG12-4]MEC3908256.1 family 43 glycosylhydrolase [Tamlana sp. 2201CG12-4]